MTAVEQPERVGAGDRLSLRCCTELAVELAGVTLDGVQRDVKLRADLATGHGRAVGRAVPRADLGDPRTAVTSARARSVSGVCQTPATPPELSAEQADATIRSKQFVGLLVVVAVIGVVVSIAAWCFLEAIFQIQQELYVHLPHAVGYQNGPPKWWSLPVLAVGALIVALAITRLPGDGGHIPAKGLSAGGPSGPDDRAGSGPGRAGDDRLRAGARPGGPADRVGRGSRRGDDQPGSPRHAAAGADAGHRLRELRRDVVHLRLPADRGGDPDRGDRDRRPQAPAPAGPRTAGGRNRVARVARNRVVVGAEHARLRARTDTAADARPPDGQSVRVDDRVGDRRRGRDELCDARRSAHLSIRLSPADARAPAGDRTDHRRARDRVLADHGQERGRGSVLRSGPAPGTRSVRPEPGRWPRWRGCSCSRAWRTACRSAATAAARRSRRCSSGPPRESCARISRASRYRQPCR